jgi:hypothetical protein
MSQSVYIIILLIKRTNLKSIIIPAGIEVGIVITLLLAAGFLEEYMINTAPSV